MGSMKLTLPHTLSLEDTKKYSPHNTKTYTFGTSFRISDSVTLLGIIVFLYGADPPVYVFSSFTIKETNVNTASRRKIFMLYVIFFM